MCCGHHAESAESLIQLKCATIKMRADENRLYFKRLECEELLERNEGLQAQIKKLESKLAKLEFVFLRGTGL